MSTHRTRPVGVGHGVAAFVLAWMSGAMIAILTGATAVMILLTLAVVAGGAASVAGWAALRSARVHEVVATALTTVGEPIVWHVHATVRRPVHAQVRCATSAGAVTVAEGTLHSGHTVFDGCAPGRGVHSTADVVLLSGGRLGMVWWRRTSVVTIDPISAAPPAAGEHATLQHHTADDDGDRALVLHAGRDEIDGVRSWRDGDELAGIHWPSTLRTGEFVVRQRLREHDEQWIARVASGTADPSAEASRARRTLEEGLAAGARVSVQVDHHEPVQLADRAAVLRWCAAFDPHDPPPASLPWWRRPLLTSPEPHAELPRVTRWLAALATAITIVMALDPLGYSDGDMALVVAGTLVAAVATTLPRPLPRSVRQLAGVVVGVVLGASLVDLGAIDDVTSSLRFLLPQMLVTLVTVQGFECVDRRGGRVSLGCSGLLATYSAGIRVDAALQVWLLVVVVVLALAVGSITRHDDKAGLLAGERRRNWQGRARTTAAVVAWVACALAVLAVVPVPRGPAQLTLPSWLSDRREVDRQGELAAPDGSPLLGGASTARGGDASTAGFFPGFSETLDISLRGELGEEVVLRVRAPEADYWRGQTYTSFDGRRWSVAEMELGSEVFRTDGTDHRLTVAYGDMRFNDGEEMIQTYYPQVDIPNLVFSAYRPTRVLIDAPLYQRADGTIRVGTAVPAGSAYTVVSERSGATPATLRLVPRIAEKWGDELYTQLPDSLTDRTRALADRLYAGSGTDYDYILAIQAWLAANTQYDLNAPVPPAGADAVDHFLFEGQLGFCEQIATATAIMLRAQGIPARVATGYVPSERDPVTGVWISRAKDAHAWVEVRFPTLGWVAFDPTASVPLSGESSGNTIGGELFQELTDELMNHLGLVLGLALAWGIVPTVMGAVRRWRHRRRRGRWGLVQDRFVAAAVRRGASPDAPNAQMAAVFDESSSNAIRPGMRPADVAAGLAAELDASAFSATWCDSDERYERASHALAVLEHTS